MSLNMYETHFNLREMVGGYSDLKVRFGNGDVWLYHKYEPFLRKITIT